MARFSLLVCLCVLVCLCLTRGFDCLRDCLLACLFFYLFVCVCVFFSMCVLLLAKMEADEVL